MWLRGLVLTVVLATPALGDSSCEAFSVDPRSVPDSVWQRTIGFALLQGRTDAPLASTRGRTFRLGIVRGLSDSGKHPPESRSDTNTMRVAVLTVREDFVQIVSDAERGVTVWVERRALGDSLRLWNQLEPGCCAQLLHLSGAERIEARAQPRDDARVVRAFNSPTAPLEILEVRDGWLLIGNHFNPLAGEAEGFQREAGWIRMRDGRGRLVFWVVDPDSC